MPLRACRAEGRKRPHRRALRESHGKRFQREDGGLRQHHQECPSPLRCPLQGKPVHSGIEEFFLNIDGYPMSIEGVKSMMRRVGAAAGVPRLHAHLCRHTYATNFLINGGNVLLLKLNPGHTTSVMVDHYVHLATSKAALLSRSFSPLDNMAIRGLYRGGNGNRRSGVRVFQWASK